MNKYQELQIDALEELGNNEEKVQKRRNKIKKVAKSLKIINAIRSRHQQWRLCPRDGVFFSTIQAQVINANSDNYKLSVQMLGKEIGKLEVNLKSKERYLFYPTYKLKHEEEPFQFGKKKKLEWSKNKEDGALIRKFILAVRKDCSSNKEQEREIQWQLAKSLTQGNKKESALKQLCPVLWIKAMTEIGVVINAHGKIKKGTGTVDLVVRRPGGRKGAKFFVFEVKRWEVNCVEDALRQAIFYAIALTYEANEGDQEACEAYRTVFGSKGNAKLKFGAVAVMEDTELNRESAKKLLKEYDPSQIDNPILDCVKILFYKNIKSWTWFEKGK